MQFTKKQKVAAILAGGAVAVAGGGVAFAYWTTTGGGSGHSLTKSTNGTVSEFATFDATGLAPGGTGVSVTYTATNSGTTSLSVATPTATISTDKTYLPASGPAVDCAGLFSLTSSSLHGGVVPAGTTSASPVAFGSATLNYADSSTVDTSSCKGGGGGSPPPPPASASHP
jgi:hypothetical protein